MLQTAMEILLTFFGTPPTAFDWTYYDKSKEFKATSGLGRTVASFALLFIHFIPDSRRESLPLFCGTTTRPNSTSLPTAHAAGSLRYFSLE